jgi:hypothetical protein
MDRIFISYRRDDAAGYAGRLEEALERALGRGSVFRDVQDMPPGADFVAAIQARLASAQAVLVLIGPRWAGGDEPGGRRIDDPKDFVRLEVALALASGVRVLPVLLPGATMPAEEALPPPMQPLARRHALLLTDTHWDEDMARLLAALGGPRRRRVGAWALGAAGVAAAALALAWLRPWAPPPDPVAPWLGVWQAEVRYAWGDRYTERFELKRHAGELTGTASFLGYPRAIESLTLEGPYLRFETRTTLSMGSETRTMTHRYSVELQGVPPGERLAMRMHSTGGFESLVPLEFQAVRAAAAASAPR